MSVQYLSEDQKARYRSSPGPGGGQIDRHAYTFCVLEALWSGLRSKDVYAVGAGRSGDPRAGLIPDALWSVHSGSILTALGLDADPGAHLRKLAGDLGEVYRELAGSLDANPAVAIRGGRLSPAKLEAAPLPEAYPAVHDAVMKMLPRIDYPELLLEVHGHTGMFDAFGHISGSTSRRADLDISLAALMVARSCNLGRGPVVKAGDPALGQHRLTGVEKGYFHHEGMGAASGKLIEAQAGIDIAREDWAAGWSPPPTGCGSWSRSAPCTGGRTRTTSGSPSGPRAPPGWRWCPTG